MKHWLLPYAAFSYLRDLYGTPDFSQWPEHTEYKAEEIAALCAPDSSCYEEIAFYYYTQYHLHIQLLDAGNYAREKGIIFKGDIPIGISRNSVEAWIEPYYFNMNGQAGAPPDAFSVNGQNWGFPTYNWEVMEQDNYQWWQKRFRKNGRVFHSLPHRPYSWFLPYLGNPISFGTWFAGTVCTGIAYECRRNSKLRAAVPKGLHDQTVHQRRDAKQDVW